MVKRSQYIKGFSRLFLLADILAFICWTGIIIVMVVFIYYLAQIDNFWPYKKIYTDAATLLFAFICLGYSPLSFVFCLPINIVKLILAGFLELDTEGVPQSDWLLFKLIAFLTLSAIPYLSKLFAWVIVLTILHLLNKGQLTSGFSIDQLPAWMWWFLAFLNFNIFYLSITAHLLVLVSAIAIRFTIFYVVGFRLQNWLGMHFTEVLGEERVNAFNDYTNTIARQEGVIPLLASIGRKKHSNS